MPARFYEQDVKSGLKQKRQLSVFIDSVVATYRSEVKTASITYIFCTDEHLLGINQQFLQHDTLTDIITFDLSASDTQLPGEIYISTERVKENAARFGVPYPEELHRVIFHGVLHLCGFKDKKAADIKLMRQKEYECLEAYSKQRY